MTGFVQNEAAFVSLQILSNDTLLNQLNETSNQYFPRMIETKDTEKTRAMLKRRFFPGGSSNRWLTEDNKKGLEDFFSESMFLYPLAEAIDQSDDGHIPTSLYYFAFQSNHSYSKFYTNSDDNYGVCHCDELAYLFRAKDLFTDYEPRSPEAAMADLFVNYIVRFAYDGVEKSNNCVVQECDILEFTNAESNFQRLGKLEDYGVDDEMVEFWRELYSQ
ncbi:juvenile hormone esterase-like [Uranotaenia lowii]|uniref:juvenile hormone esterase-like n=1 Tax=Uranotaenia lowii TaxID=190385 RepID=UPI002479F86D|nr:juvenile hormone esterase-like [Uranotaenia lowii]